ncbi:MAG: amidohydrolase family protein [Gemmatimonadota bacterium]|nr:amidohydrolase family protein [Gemmatimonadota bacterium]
MRRYRAVLLIFALHAACTAEPETGLATRYDWLIAGGTVVNGSGEAAQRADVLLRDGRIAFVGQLDEDTIAVRDRFDATGLIVAPGFIDAHAHGDPVGAPRFPNFLAMGVTTIVLGQDGGGPQASGLSAHMDSVDAAHPSVNVAYLVGHNTIRRESGVGFDEAGEEGLARMAALVAQGIEAGAFGLSTGLEYDPGSRASADELAAIAVPVAAADGVVSSHLRSEDADRIAPALEELIEQARRSGARVHASHLKIVLGNDLSAAAGLLEAMDAARAQGVEITGDVYPYTASYTGIGILFPDWAKAPNDYTTVVGERREELAAHLRARVESRNGPEATLFGSSEWAGRTLAEVAAETGQPFEDVLIDLGPGGASAAYFVMDEGVMAALLSDPNIVVSSDGSPTMLHPRGHGAFPRVLRQYAIDGVQFTLEEAIHKMSGLTARIFRLDDEARVDVPRGQVREGWAADVIVFEPSEVRDPASFGDPHRLAEGMHAVFVGGEPGWLNGAPTPGDGHGRALRSLSANND